MGCFFLTGLVVDRELVHSLAMFFLFFGVVVVVVDVVVVVVMLSFRRCCQTPTSCKRFVTWSDRSGTDGLVGSVDGSELIV